MNIGFVPFEWKDALDILLVTGLIYLIYQFIRGTIASQIALVLVGIFAFDAVVTALDLTTLQALFGAVSEVFVVAVIILFAPEIRRALFLLGRTSPLARRFGFSGAAQREAIDKEIVAAVMAMSRERVGALIVLSRATGLRNYVESGTPIGSQVEQDLLRSIFYPNSPLHDGAVIIQGTRIEAARCILPVSEARRLDPNFGLRHRAALGVTERSDAFVIVTSEETGRISVAENGSLASGLTVDQLAERLRDAFSDGSAAESVDPLGGEEA